MRRIIDRPDWQICLAGGLLGSLLIVLASPILIPFTEWIPLTIFHNLRRSQQADTRISIFAIHEQMEYGHYARLIEYLRKNHARVIALDLILGERPNDELLVDVAPKSRDVVLGFKFLEGDRKTSITPDYFPPKVSLRTEKMWRFINEVKSLEVYGRLAEQEEILLGFLNRPTVASIFTLEASMVLSFNGWYYPSLALSAIRRYCGNEPILLQQGIDLSNKPILELQCQGRERIIPISREGRLLINYNGFSRSNRFDVTQEHPEGQCPILKVRHMECEDAECEENIDTCADGASSSTGRFADALDGDIVFLGRVAPGEDEHRVPSLDWWPGVDIHATIADNLLNEDYLTDFSREPRHLVSAVIFIGLLASLAASWRHGKYEALILTCLWGLFCSVTFVYANVVFNVVSPILAAFSCQYIALVFLSIKSKVLIRRLEAKRAELAERIRDRDKFHQQETRDLLMEIYSLQDASRPHREQCTILFIATAVAKGDHERRLDEMSRDIQRKIQATKFRDALKFETRWAVRDKDLQQVFLDTVPHVVHLSGYESPQKALVELFALLKDRIKLVVFDAGYSKPQAEAVAETIDCAVGVKEEVDDDAAIAFATGLYCAVGYGRSIKKAFDLGKNQVCMEQAAGADLFELISRTGVDASEITLVGGRSRR